MSKIVGIDLGTTNSLVTAFIDGKSILIPNAYGEVLTPSVVSLTEKGDIVVGKAAKDRLVSSPDMAAAVFKRKMGKDTKIKLGKKSFLPEELSSFILRQLLADAETYLNRPIAEAIISVPAYFGATQRAATKMAGSLSGAKVERLVNEPSAAALACRDWDRDETFVVIDFGGGTLDVSIVETFDNIVNVCAIAGNNFLGGVDFDHAIAEAVCKENDLDMAALSAHEYQILLKAAETAKIALEDVGEAVISINMLGKPVEYTLTDHNLFFLSQSILERLKKPIQAAVRDSGLSIRDIDKCILVGGSCKMPVVQDFLSSLLRVPVTYSQDTDKVVAQGLGTYVGIKQRAGEVKDLVLTDICPFSLNISVHNRDNPQKPLTQTMIPRNSALPTSRTSAFFTVEPGQTTIEVLVNQGEEIYAADNTELGKINVQVPLNRKEHEQIDVTFTYDINAILAVQVKVPSTGKQYQLMLAGKGLDIPENQLNKYVQNIQNFKLAHYQRLDLLRERAKRIYAEVGEDAKAFMQSVTLGLENMDGLGSIRKVSQTLDEMEEYLDQVESGLGGDDIFNNMPVFLRLIKSPKDWGEGLNDDWDEGHWEADDHE